jgi:hypothetical protein
MISVGRVHIDRIPEFFLERYDREIAAWATNFEKIGPVKTFVLREGHLANVSPDPEQGAELIGVKLICKISRKGVEIAPYTPRDEVLIALHCEKLQRAGIGSKQFTPEPTRPGLPVFPTIHANPVRPLDETLQ